MERTAEGERVLGAIVLTFAKERDESISYWEVSKRVGCLATMHNWMYDQVLEEPLKVRGLGGAGGGLGGAGRGGAGLGGAGRGVERGRRGGRAAGRWQAGRAAKTVGCTTPIQPASLRSSSLLVCAAPPPSPDLAALPARPAALQPHECLIDFIAVSPAARGKGVGALLMAWAQETGTAILLEREPEAVAAHGPLMILWVSGGAATRSALSASC